MVARVWGKCEGQSINFTRNLETGRWETTVPATKDGEYIIELWAEDYAGNIGYFATIKVAWDTTQLCMTVEILDVGSMFSMDEVKQVLFGSNVVSRVLKDGLRVSLWPDEVLSKVVRCERCGL